MKEKPFKTEVDLCARFIEAVGDKWVSYAETGGHDILLVRKTDGFQIGIQAKLRLGIAVINQAIEEGQSYRVCNPGPDCRAIMVPEGCNGDFGRIAAYIGFTIIEVRARGERRFGTGYQNRAVFTPALPTDGHSWQNRDWSECLPTKRHALPAYIPDVKAGAPAPVQLTDWKIGAMKIAITSARRGFVTRADFKAHCIDHRRFTAADGWLTKCACGAGWFARNIGLGFDIQHQRVYKEIVADADKWMLQMPLTPRTIKTLL